MIKVVIYRRDQQITGFEISGHANSGPYGHDIVCAGVSAVSFGAVNAALKLSNLKLNITQGDGGYLFVKIPEKTATDEQLEKVRLIFEAMVISLETIAREYGNFIEIEEVAT